MRQNKRINCWVKNDLNDSDFPDPFRGKVFSRGFGAGSARTPRVNTAGLKAGLVDILNSYITEGMIESLDVNNERILAYDLAYQSVKVTAVQDEMIKSLKTNFGSTNPIVAVMQKTVEPVSEVKTSLAIDTIILATKTGCELIVPVHHYENIPNTSCLASCLENDLCKHVFETVKKLTSNSKEGRFGGYLAIRTDIDPSKIQDALVRVPAEMQRANISIKPYVFVLPITGNYERSTILTVTQSWLKYHLIGLNKEARAIFPAYKIPFEIITKESAFMAWVTSADKETEESADTKGNYICSRSSGNMKDALKRMRLEVGDKVKITELVQGKEYQVMKILPDLVY